MPAVPLSACDPVLDQLAASIADTVPPPVSPAGLLAVFARLADPRKRRGRCYELPVLLTLATCAVLAGARSFTAVAEWAADAGEVVWAALGIVRTPDESTFRRVFARLDADAFDTALGTWAAAATVPPDGRLRIAVGCHDRHVHDLRLRRPRGAAPRPARDRRFPRQPAGEQGDRRHTPSGRPRAARPPGQGDRPGVHDPRAARPGRGEALARRPREAAVRLADLGGDTGLAIGTAWRTKEHLRAVLALSPTRTGLATCRTDIDRALTRFFEYAATTGATVPEVVTLAETVSRWREEIANAVLHGLTNVVHQQTRTRYVASRATRPACPLPVTTTTSAA
nr:transposase family protein [Frankia sp. Cas3]